MRRRKLGLLTAALCLASAVLAQAWPGKPVHVIARAIGKPPFDPGKDPRGVITLADSPHRPVMHPSVPAGTPKVV